MVNTTKEGLKMGKGTDTQCPCSVSNNTTALAQQLTWVMAPNKTHMGSVVSFLHSQV